MHTQSGGHLPPHAASLCRAYPSPTTRSSAVDALIAAFVSIAESEPLSSLSNLRRLSLTTPEPLHKACHFGWEGWKSASPVQHEDGRLEYWGRSDIIAKLSETDPSTMPWQQLAFLRGGPIGKSITRSGQTQSGR